MNPNGSSKLFEYDAPKVLDPLSEAVPSSDLPEGRQPRHTPEAARHLELQLKSFLEELAIHLFGKGESYLMDIINLFDKYTFTYINFSKLNLFR